MDRELLTWDIDGATTKLDCKNSGIDYVKRRSLSGSRLEKAAITVLGRENIVI